MKLNITLLLFLVYFIITSNNAHSKDYSQTSRDSRSQYYTKFHLEYLKNSISYTESLIEKLELSNKLVVKSDSSGFYIKNIIKSDINNNLFNIKQTDTLEITTNKVIFPFKEDILYEIKKNYLITNSYSSDNANKQDNSDETIKNYISSLEIVLVILNYIVLEDINTIPYKSTKYNLLEENICLIEDKEEYLDKLSYDLFLEQDKFHLSDMYHDDWHLNNLVDQFLNSFSDKEKQMLLSIKYFILNNYVNSWKADELTLIKNTMNTESLKDMNRLFKDLDNLALKFISSTDISFSKYSHYFELLLNNKFLVYHCYKHVINNWYMIDNEQNDTDNSKNNKFVYFPIIELFRYTPLTIDFSLKYIEVMTDFKDKSNKSDASNTSFHNNDENLDINTDFNDNITKLQLFVVKTELIEDVFINHRKTIVYLDINQTKTRSYNFNYNISIKENSKLGKSQETEIVSNEELFLLESIISPVNWNNFYKLNFFQLKILQKANDNKSTKNSKLSDIDDQHYHYHYSLINFNNEFSVLKEFESLGYIIKHGEYNLDSKEFLDFLVKLFLVEEKNTIILSKDNNINHFTTNILNIRSIRSIKRSNEGVSKFLIDTLHSDNTNTYSSDSNLIINIRRKLNYGNKIINMFNNILLFNRIESHGVIYFRNKKEDIQNMNNVENNNEAYEEDVMLNLFEYDYKNDNEAYKISSLSNLILSLNYKLDYYKYLITQIVNKSSSSSKMDIDEFDIITINNYNKIIEILCSKLKIVNQFNNIILKSMNTKIIEDLKSTKLNIITNILKTAN